MTGQISFGEIVTRFSSLNSPGNSSPEFGVSDEVQGFVHPQLEYKHDLESADPKVTFISARGAAGKSTLARELSNRTGIPLWRLDIDKAVSGSALPLHLHDYADVSSPRAVIIDSLDEARMRVSVTSWREFLDSLLEAEGIRWILLGRDRVLEDTWLTLGLDDADLMWCELSHFDAQRRVEYVDAIVRRREPKYLNTEYYVDFRDSIIRSLLRSLPGVAQEKFVGYAPVLDAVGAMLCVNNLYAFYQQLGESLESGSNSETLANIIDRLLEREQRKAGPLAQELRVDPSLAYSKEEQLDWLASSIWDLNEPDLTYIDSEDDRAAYREGIQKFLEDHPFRDEGKWSSIVFEAYVAAARFSQIGGEGLLGEIGNRSGLLFDFVSDIGAGESEIITEEQLAALQASVIAGAGSGSQTSISANQDCDGSYLISIDPGRDSEVGPRTFTLLSERDNILRLLGPLEELTVVTVGEVEVPARDDSVQIGSDVYIECMCLRLGGSSVNFSPRMDWSNGDDRDPGIVLKVASKVSLPSQIFGRKPETAMLEIQVPPNLVLAYPWIEYRADFVDEARVDPEDRAVRFLNMLMRLTRNHGHRGERAVFLKKLEGRQSIKREKLSQVVEFLEERGVVSRSGEMLFFREGWEQFRFSGRRMVGQRLLDDVPEWRPILDGISEIIAR